MTERRREKFLSVLQRRQPDMTLVMEDVHDPHNVSAVLRTADAVGLLEIQLVYKNEELPKLGKKSSSSAVKWVQRRKFTSIMECYDQLHEEEFTVYATQIGVKSKSIYNIDCTKKVAFVFGNEHRGVSKEAAKLADGLIEIPMMGIIQSLNVSVACAVTLYEALRQRSAVGMYKKSAMPNAAIKKLFDEWMKK